MNRLFRKLSLAVVSASAVFLLSPNFAHAQDIYAVTGGRTTATLSKAFLADLTKAGIIANPVAGSQLLGDQITFPIASGAISLETAKGQILHGGGLRLTTSKKEIRLFGFVANTLGEESTITALAEANGKFLGRITVFDLTLPDDLKLPIDPSDGDFFLAGVNWNLDPQGAAALNDAFGIDVFTNNLYIGHSLSLAFVPLNADGI